LNPVQEAARLRTGLLDVARTSADRSSGLNAAKADPMFDRD
jgi:hypothetical protein